MLRIFAQKWWIGLNGSFCQTLFSIDEMSQAKWKYWLDRIWMKVIQWVSTDLVSCRLSLFHLKPSLLAERVGRWYHSSQPVWLPVNIWAWARYRERSMLKAISFASRLDALWLSPQSSFCNQSSNRHPKWAAKDHWVRDPAESHYNLVVGCHFRYLLPPSPRSLLGSGRWAEFETLHCCRSPSTNASHHRPLLRGWHSSLHVPRCNSHYQEALVFPIIAMLWEKSNGLNLCQKHHGQWLL